ncbi:MAG: hypothetical protein NTZ29_04180 [Verrucomicrobia bacterium]|nr:hypothetical protein [Verrucomicrobiota bacterium]
MIAASSRFAGTLEGFDGPHPMKKPGASPTIKQSKTVRFIAKESHGEGRSSKPNSSATGSQKRINETVFDAGPSAREASSSGA